MEQQQQSSTNNNTNNNNQQNHRNNNNNNNNNRRRHHNNNNRNNNNNTGAAASSGPSGGTPLQPRDNNVTKENNIAVPASKSQQQQNQNQNQSKANQQRRNNNNNRAQQQHHRKPKNTECFDPDHSAPDMRVVLDLGREKLTTKLCTRDVLLCPNLFTQPGDEHLHDKLLKELEECTVPKDQLMKLWHNDSHLIANDRTGFVKQCPIFQSVVDRIAKFFNMKINATRFDHYRDTTDWKPLHFDAAQFNPSLAKIQNITVGVSFGCTRDADFERADDSKNVVTFPLTNGSTYVFCQELNCMWRHGIRQLPPEKQTKDSRISIIAWGWVDQSTWEKL